MEFEDFIMKDKITKTASPSFPEIKSTDPKEMAIKLSPLDRHLISSGYDSALTALANVFPLDIHEYPTGYTALSWIVPEGWHVNAARVESLNGEIVFSIQDNPLHVVSYSLPYSGVVSTEELKKHLHTHSTNPDAIPFVIKYYDRDWGLCCSQRQKKTLTDPEYRVIIDSRFSQATLKTGTWAIQGESKNCFVFCCHLCHANQFNDGLSGVIGGLKVMEAIKRRSKTRYSYKLVILPETIGSACWLEKHQEEIPTLKGGMFLEMLATQEYGWRVKHSNQPDSYFDSLVAAAFWDCREQIQETDFLDGMLNDERMFNGPGIGCPMMSLQCVNFETGSFPYYHTNFDTWENASFEKLQRSIHLILKYIDILEKDYIPLPNFRGELMVSRYKSLDYATMGKTIRILTFGMDGKTPLSALAKNNKIPFYELYVVSEKMAQEGLIIKKDIII